MDAHAVEFYEWVRVGYLEMVKQEPDRWVVLDSGQPCDDVQQELRKVIESKLGQQK